MDRAMVSQVRRFNRIVTQRVGALEDRFLARDHSLGEARMLWEIGPEGRDVRSLRTGLSLDSGYVSRLLRSLEAARLVTVSPSDTDKRIKSARLTAAGSAEWTVLDERAECRAESLLAPLTSAQRVRLVAAMADVEHLMTVAMVDMAPIDPDDPRAQYCLQSYVSELNRRFEAGWDPSRSISAAEAELRPPSGIFLLASLHGNPIGCGAIKFHGEEPAEIKRMWVSDSARGLGIGRRLLHEIEAQAAIHGIPTLRLETNRALKEAINLYRSAGYVEVDAFNDEPYAHHWFEKRIAGPAE
jgi:DNA-binding MarR family transcriptional regulator/N-acetylglutamate synthase-like GNAT family acetyltransferase